MEFSEEQLQICDKYVPFEIFEEIIKRIDPSNLFHLPFVNKLFHFLVSRRITLINTEEDYLRVCETGDYLSLIHSQKTYPWGLGSHVYEDGLFSVSKFGDIRMVEILAKPFEKRTDAHSCDRCRQTMHLLAWGIEGASAGGHINIVSWLISKEENIRSNAGTPDPNKIGACCCPDDLLCAVGGAAKHGNVELVDWFLSRGASRGYAICGAAEGNHKNILDKLNPTTQKDFIDALEGYCSSNNYDGVRKILPRINKPSECTEALYTACICEYKDIVHMLIEWGFDRSLSSWTIEFGPLPSYERITCFCNKSMEKHHDLLNI